MKKLFNAATVKILLLITFISTQFTAFAADTTENGESRWQVVSRMPKFWIGVVLFLLFTTLAFRSGRKETTA